MKRTTDYQILKAGQQVGMTGIGHKNQSSALREARRLHGAEVTVTPFRVDHVPGCSCGAPYCPERAEV